MDALRGILMTCVGEVEVDHGRCEPGVSEGALDETEGDASFEQRGGVGRSESMESQGGCADTGALFGSTEGALDTVSAHGKSCGRAVLVITTGGRKEPGLVPGCFPGGS